MKQVIGLISICLLCSTLLSAQLSITIESKTVTIGEEFCLDLTVEGFQNILSFQAQFIQDDSLLTFSRFANAAFPDSLWEDSYTHDGRIAWISEELIEGGSMEDSSFLISVCYTATNSGVSPVSIFNQPTGPLWLQFLPLEVFNSDHQLMEVSINAGVVIIEDPFAAKEAEVSEENLTTATSDLVHPGSSYQLLPNLVTDYLNVITTDQTFKEIRLYGLDGHLHQSIQTIDKEVSIQTSNLAKGSYLVQIQTAREKVTRKFVKI